MPTPFQNALARIRAEARDTTELGGAFEQLVKVFLEHDATQTQEYKRVWHYKDWAKEHPTYSKTDIGIDLVAELNGSSGFCAIQCKCYEPDDHITKEDIDSFISASSTPHFSRLLLVDTSVQELSKHARSVLDNLDTEYIRLPLIELEESRIDWDVYIRDDRVRFHDRKPLWDHQRQAIDALKEGLAEADRGKLIMACGTGKTFTTLCAAEEMVGKGKLVLYMVPSLALMSQTIRAWKNDASDDFTAFSACSDIKVGRRKKYSDEIIIRLTDLAFPATTDSAKLAEQVKNADTEKMTVVFSTYQSIDVISRAQYDHDLKEFDLIICDEAHRTTGATLGDEDESHFVRIHDNENVRGAKRIYMTATPRIYGEKARHQAEDSDVALASMDDESLYGKTLFFRGFGWAVENNLLTDYKVLVFAVDEGLVSARVQRSLAAGTELQLDDVTKMVGCYKALIKDFSLTITADQEKYGEIDLTPMKRAIAFCQSISLSEMFEEEFAGVIEEYIAQEEKDLQEQSAPNEDEAKNGVSWTNVPVSVRHVDGTFNASKRTEILNWLKDDTEENTCRVVTNVRCLSEGVDVPDLDAVMFLHPRKSQIDVVQSVGRVMRKSDYKDMGYVILPITVPPGVTATKALDDNTRYQVVWQILNALRAHDERLDSTINRIGLGEDVSDRIEIFGVGNREELEATTAVVEDLKLRKRDADTESDDSASLGDEVPEDFEPAEKQLSFVLPDISQAIKAKIVEKCGTRDYWETWAVDIAKIAKRHITRITGVVTRTGTPEHDAFNRFAEEIRDDLNPEISDSDAIEMLAQHLVTKPVFDALFQGNRFVEENPVSKAMQGVLDQLDQHQIEKESATLTRFYESVQRRAADISTAMGRQKLVLELYDRFFSKAFPAHTQRLGIVYTPTEVVDFIIHSVEHIMQEEFGKGLDSPNVHILDPFTGTGTFITRLMQSGVISPEQLAHKYKNELHANEIVLLAYYIAAINIEAVYQDLSEEEAYQPFTGSVLTDTFQLYEQERDMIADLLPDNSNRRTAQKECDLTVIIGNPPYSSGQKSANDNLANIKYSNLDSRIAETYVASSKQGMGKSKLYDSYIRAFRWASDRIGNEGIVGFVSGAAWVDRNFADGMRKHLSDEFSKIYVFHLRGDIRKNMLSKGLAGEGQNVFGQSSMTGIAITILVKNTSATDHQILFHDIGKDLNQKEKLSILKRFKSIEGITSENKWKLIEPDEDHDWINQGDKAFKKHIQIGSKKEKLSTKIFNTYSLGILSNRDSWVYNFSRDHLKNNLENMLKTFHGEQSRLKGLVAEEVKSKLDLNEKRIKWTTDIVADLIQGKTHTFDPEKIGQSLYRPFTKVWWYSDASWNWSRHLMPVIFPVPETDNLVIAVTSIGGRSGFSCLMTDQIPDRQLIDNGQCFPLKLYEKQEAGEGLFAGQGDPNEHLVRDGITDEALQHFQAAYPNEQFTKEDLFYYMYGLLHSPEYRERFQNNLSKELPRIPAVRRFEDFQSFSDAGRKLGDLHVNYETVKPYPVTFKEGDLRLADSSDPESFYRVKKMKFAGKRPNLDKTTVVYNRNLTMVDVPLEAYEYVVSGRSALDWVMNRQCVKTHKASGIVNDANDYANETMNDPAYPLKLFQRVITVSLETMKIVRGLPTLDID